MNKGDVNCVVPCHVVMHIVGSGGVEVPSVSVDHFRPFGACLYQPL